MDDDKQDDSQSTFNNRSIKRRKTTVDENANFCDGQKKPPIIRINQIDYGFSKFLAQGSFGRCYLYTNLSENKKVVIKMIIKTPEAEREMNIFRKLKHQNIVRCFCTKVVNSNLIHIVMESCKTSLDITLKTGGSLSVITTRKYMVDVLKGLVYLHNLNIVHRDIKLGNLLISSSDTIKICDFGLATSVDDKRATFAGTANYIAPEYIRRKEFATTKGDIWSLGCCMYTLLVGTVPFKGKSQKETLKRTIFVIYRKPVSLMQKFGGLGAMREIELMLEVDSAQRLPADNFLTRPFFTKSVFNLSDTLPNDNLRIFNYIWRAQNDIAISRELLCEALCLSIRKDEASVPHRLVDFNSTVWIVSYIDYCSLGLYYILSNSTMGFLAMDSKVLLISTDEHVYIDVSDGRHETKLELDASFELKLSILRIFKEELTKSYDDFTLFNTSNDRVYITNFVVTPLAFVATLSNKTIQITLCDNKAIYLIDSFRIYEYQKSNDNNNNYKSYEFRDMSEDMFELFRKILKLFEKLQMEKSTCCEFYN